MKMFITDDYRKVEGCYGYCMLTTGMGLSHAFCYELFPNRYMDFNLMNGHFFRKEDFIYKNRPLKRFVIIPETKADNDLLQMSKDCIKYYRYYSSSLTGSGYTMYPEFFGVEEE